MADLWRYRDLIRLLAVRDIKLRFRQTRLGVAWLVLQPLLFTGAYAFLFGSIGQVKVGGHNYFVYTYVGMSMWGTFQSAFNRTGNCLLLNKDLLTQVYFPRLCVPFGSVTGGQVDVLIAWTMLGIFLIAGGEHLGPALLLVPLWFLVTQVLGVACGLLIASWTIAFRDLQNITSLVIAAGPIITPIAYPSSALPHGAKWLATFNPLTPLFDGIRWSALGESFPGAIAVSVSVAVTVVLFLIACAVFRSAERTLADVI